MPNNVTYFDGTIRDDANDIDIVGTDEFALDGVQVVCVEMWEEVGQREEPS